MAETGDDVQGTPSTSRRRGCRQQRPVRIPVQWMSCGRRWLVMVLLGARCSLLLVCRFTKCEGSLYRGVVPPLLGVTPIFAVSFWVSSQSCMCAVVAPVSDRTRIGLRYVQAANSELDA